MFKKSYRPHLCLALCAKITLAAFSHAPQAQTLEASVGASAAYLPSHNPFGTYGNPAVGEIYETLPGLDIGIRWHPAIPNPSLQPFYVTMTYGYGILEAKTSGDFPYEDFPKYPSAVAALGESLTRQSIGIGIGVTPKRKMSTAPLFARPFFLVQYTLNDCRGVWTYDSEERITAYQWSHGYRVQGGFQMNHHLEVSGFWSFANLKRGDQAQYRDGEYQGRWVPTGPDHLPEYALGILISITGYWRYGNR